MYGEIELKRSTFNPIESSFILEFVLLGKEKLKIKKLKRKKKTTKQYMNCRKNN